MLAVLVSLVCSWRTVVSLTIAHMEAAKNQGPHHRDTRPQIVPYCNKDRSNSQKQPYSSRKDQLLACLISAPNPFNGALNPFKGPPPIYRNCQVDSSTRSARSRLEPELRLSLGCKVDHAFGGVCMVAFLQFRVRRAHMCMHVILCACIWLKEQ